MGFSSLFLRSVRFVCRPFVKLDGKLERKLERKTRERNIKNAKQVQRFSYVNPRDTFFSKIRIITHAGGGLQGMCYLNCKEALPFYYDKGNRVFEYDVEQKGENYLLTHTDASNPQGNLDGRFTPLGLLECLAFLEAHEDMILIFDCKFENLGAFAEYVKAHAQESMLQRIVIQVFNEQNILDIRKVYDFKMLHVCMYATDYVQTVQTCIKYGVGAVSVSVKALNERADWEIFEKNDICVFAYTVNTLKEYNLFKEKGITGVFSDFLYDTDVESAGA